LIIDGKSFKLRNCFDASWFQHWSLTTDE